jgi:hypothetical protein
MSESTTAAAVKQPRRRAPKGPSKGELLERLIELRQQIAQATARAEQAEARAQTAEGQAVAQAAANRLATAPDTQLSLQPDKEGVIRFWAMSRDEAYRLQIDPTAPDGPVWTWSKWTDGTVYTMREAAGGLGELFDCSCPGCKQYGPRCNQGRGCKHARMLRAIRQLVDPGM